MSRMSPLIHMLSVPLFVLFVTSAAPLAAQEHDPKLDALADHLAQRLTEAKLVGVSHSPSVAYLVFDFVDTRGQRSQLGVHLADALSEALSNKLPGLAPIQRSKLTELCIQEALDPLALQPDAVASWAASTLGASLAIVGTIEPRAEQFNLHLRVVGEDSKEVTDAGGYLDWTEERRGWDRLRPPLPLISRPQRRDLPTWGRGYSEPICVHCPSPPYTEVARKAFVSGIIQLELTVAEDGRVEEVVPIRGLPCGMTQQAVTAAKTWKFRPIIGPDGKATEMRVTWEMNFRISSSQ